MGIVLGDSSLYIVYGVLGKDRCRVTNKEAITNFSSGLSLEISIAIAYLAI